LRARRTVRKTLAFKIASEKNPDLPEGARRHIAAAVGLGAVKYADLLPNRQSDYVFSWDRMLALNGNTAVYLLYSYARVRSILRRSSRVAGRADCSASVIGAATTIRSGPIMPSSTCSIMCEVNVESDTKVDAPTITQPAQNDTVRAVAHWRPLLRSRHAPRR